MNVLGSFHELFLNTLFLLKLCIFITSINSICLQCMIIFIVRCLYLYIIHLTSFCPLPCLSSPCSLQILPREKRELRENGNKYIILLGKFGTQWSHHECQAWLTAFSPWVKVSWGWTHLCLPATIFSAHRKETWLGRSRSVSPLGLSICPWSREISAPCPFWCGQRVHWTWLLRCLSRWATTGKGWVLVVRDAQWMAMRNGLLCPNETV